MHFTLLLNNSKGPSSSPLKTSWSPYDHFLESSQHRQKTAQRQKILYNDHSSKHNNNRRSNHNKINSKHNNNNSKLNNNNRDNSSKPKINIWNDRWDGSWPLLFCSRRHEGPCLGNQEGAWRVGHGGPQGWEGGGAWRGGAEEMKMEWKKRSPTYPSLKCNAISKKRYR